MEEMYNKRAVVVTKNIIPLCAKLLDDNKAELKSTNTKLLQKIYSVMGRGMLDHVPGNKLRDISEIVSLD
jgi:hypothetical protein